MTYQINEIYLEDEAPERYENLSLTERDRGGRVIGGDKGDLWFEGYYVENGKTFLINPTLETTLNLTDDNAQEVAMEVLSESYDSIGIEAVY
jgi:hypothetical protein